MDELLAEVAPRQLAHLVAVSDHRNLSRAADAVGIAPRALLRSVRDLERAAGRPLLTVSDRAVTLTPAGESVARAARRVLHGLRRLAARASDERATRRVDHIPCTDTLSVILDEVVPQRPWLRIEESVAGDRQQLSELREHRIDVALCTAPTTSDDDLVGTPVRADQLLSAPANRGQKGQWEAPTLVAPVFGAAWPAHDELICHFEDAASTRCMRVAIPVGSGHELNAVRRAAQGASLLASASVLGARGGAPLKLDSVPLCLNWLLVCRAGDDSPVVRDFCSAAMLAAERRGWLHPAGARPRGDRQGGSRAPEHAEQRRSSTPGPTAAA